MKGNAMKTYYGLREDGVCRVRVMDDRRDVGGHAYLLPIRLDLWNHSPTGFEWGYGGSGPAQTALALLADALGDDGWAVRLHQEFKWAYVSRWAGNNREAGLVEQWRITDEEIRAWADDQEFQRMLQQQH